MKITFPHLGNLYIAASALLAGLKQQTVVPPPMTARTLSLGSEHAPESACMPMKLNLGNFIEALELGADTIVMPGGWGPCRFGWFAQSEADILHALGYRFDLIVLEKPQTGWKDLPQRLRPLTAECTWRDCWQALRWAWSKLHVVEQLEQERDYYLPRVRDKQAMIAFYRQGRQELERAATDAELFSIKREYEEEMQALPQHGRCCPRVGLVGEIYTLLEPMANYHLLEELGRLNVECFYSARLSDWVNDHLLGGWAKASLRRDILTLARPYVGDWVGGRGQETAGEAVMFARQGLDGIIQIGPLGCMPELVAQSVLPELSRREGLPVMSLWLDEHSGTGGLLTRLEAFSDLLQRQMLMKRGEANGRLVGGRSGIGQL